MSPPLVAISIKQPWAALLVAGLKTVEVRTWPTSRRGPVLIHTGKTPDDRAESWSHITTPALREAAERRGGIVGIAELAECRRYESPDAFAADTRAHRNAPEWFLPPRLYGFVFQDARPLTFYPYPGQTLFFRVRGFVPPSSG